MNTRHTPAESVNTRPAREESDRKAIERAENEGLAEPARDRGAGSGVLNHLGATTDECGMEDASWTTEMNDDDRERMQALGITVARRNVYSYKEFKYERLDDAIRYAEIDAGRDPQQLKAGSERFRSGPSRVS